MAFEKNTEEYQRRRNKALGMGGLEKLAQRKSEGVLNARERLDHLMDKDSFLELGLFATSPRPETRERTPADGKVSGFGKIGGRPVAVVANDFTVMGASSTQVNGRKISHLKQLATRRGTPMIFLGESTGARMPDIMGATGIGAGDRPTQFLRMRETPWVSAVLGSAFGSTAWYAAMSDFVVMRKGSVMAVSSPRLASMATGEIIDGESLGGWRLHTERSGLVDLAVDTDAKALDAIKRFLSYLPSHHNERPPVAEVPAGCDEPIKHVFEVFPDSATKAYDVRRIIERIFDIGSVFELKARYGKPIVTALARLNGHTIGVLANNPLYKGGAIDIDGCIKATGFIVLCDSFNIPLVFLVDQPGFLIGIEGEMRGAPGRVINWMNALALITVPKVSIILRKSYGQSMVNMGGAGNSDTLACWFTGEVSFMDPRFGVKIVHGVKPEDDPERFQALLTEMSKDTSAYSMASNYSAHAVIDPRETREYLVRTLEFDQLRLSAGIGEHLMRTWPTSIL